MPGAASQMRSSVPRPVTISALAISGVLSMFEVEIKVEVGVTVAVTGAPSLQRFEEGSNVRQFRARQIKRRHQGSGLQRLRIGDPARQGGNVVRQGPRR